MHPIIHHKLKHISISLLLDGYILFFLELKDPFLINNMAQASIETGFDGELNKLK